MLRKKDLLLLWKGSPQAVSKEMVASIELAKDSVTAFLALYLKKDQVTNVNITESGLHAVIFAVSTKSSFSTEIYNGLESYFSILGPKVLDHLIVVFTECSGDQQKDVIIDAFLAAHPHTCPHLLQNFLRDGRDRCIIYNIDDSKNEAVLADRTQHLLKLIEDVILANEGRPYTSKMFDLAEKEAMLLCEVKREVDALPDCTDLARSDLMKGMRESFKQKLNLLAQIAKIKSPAIEKAEASAIEQAAKDEEIR